SPESRPTRILTGSGASAPSSHQFWRGLSGVVREFGSSLRSVSGREMEGLRDLRRLAARPVPEGDLEMALEAKRGRISGESRAIDVGREQMVGVGVEAADLGRVERDTPHGEHLTERVWL